MVKDIRNIVPEEALAEILANIQKHWEIAAKLAEDLDAYKRGKIDVNALHSQSLKLSSHAIESLQDPEMKLSIYFMGRAMDNYRKECVREWEANDRKFTPKTDMEQDLFDAFHEAKSEGYSVIVWISDSFQRDFYFRAVGKGVNLDDALKEVQQLGMTKIMVAMNLNREFDEQWPYVPGHIFSPAQLTSNPLITIPKLAEEVQQSRPHAPFVRGVIENPNTRP